jgi:hypothetical protein
MFAALGAFLLKFATSGIVDKLLDHKRKQLETATEQQKIVLQRDIAKLQDEQDRRKRIAELQALEYQHPVLWLAKFLIMIAVAQYVFARFSVKTWGLDDFNIAVAPLDAWEQGVVVVVLSYIFMSK